MTKIIRPKKNGFIDKQVHRIVRQYNENPPSFKRFILRGINILIILALLELGLQYSWVIFIIANLLWISWGAAFVFYGLISSIFHSYEIEVYEEIYGHKPFWAESSHVSYEQKYRLGTLITFNMGGWVGKCTKAILTASLSSAKRYLIFLAIGI